MSHAYHCQTAETLNLSIYMYMQQMVFLEAKSAGYGAINQVTF